MNLDQRLSNVERTYAGEHEPRSAHLRRYLLALAVRLLASVADRRRQRVSAILNHADPDRRSDPLRPASIGARWHRW